MGDCRIRVDIAKELIGIGSHQVEPKNDGSTITFTHTCSADTTIRELCETIKELKGIVGGGLPFLWLVS